MWQKIKQYKRVFMIAILTAVIGSTLVSLSVPTSYCSRIKMSVESSSSNLDFNDLSSLSAKFLSKDNFATLPNLYYDIINSPEFADSIKKIPLTCDGKQCTYGEHIQKNNPMPWWERLVWGDDMPTLVRSCIKCEIKPRTELVTIQVKDVRPEIAQQMADSVSMYIQQFVTHHKTIKTAAITQYYKDQRLKAGEAYHKAQRDYVNYAMAHWGDVPPSVEATREKKQQEADAKFLLYSKFATLHQKSAMEQQKSSPAFTIIQNSTIPTKTSNPRWLVNLAVWLFYAFMLLLWYILYQENHLKRL